ncbi:hypothetical protein [Mycolicibacterium neoaurum]|uniref:hypothetical protein n=1 Tax=Mycolicibacterium neoaurum TaxID=1795 RepID=UPI001F4C9173|nr:hypothetical protein [Mycolicibacterium neoaurum]
MLLLPILIAMIGIARDRNLMGAFAVGRVGTVIYGLTTAVIAGCVVALAVTTVIG